MVISAANAVLEVKPVAYVVNGLIDLVASVGVEVGHIDLFSEWSIHHDILIFIFIPIIHHILIHSYDSS